MRRPSRQFDLARGMSACWRRSGLGPRRRRPARTPRSRPAAAARRRAAAAAPAAAPLPDADPALWVVRDADTTIYLFGTFHLLDGRPWFNDEVKTAFDASRRAGDGGDPARRPDAALLPMIMRYAVDPQGRTLSARLTAGGESRR